MNQQYGERESATVEPEPWLYRRVSMPHYYGDNVRGLLLAAAVIMLVGAPWYANNLQAELPLYLLGALILVCFAAFTSPRSHTMLIADTIVAGVGMALFEQWALSSYESVALSVFALRQLIALIFFFAFYFAGKTVRALVVDRKEYEDSNRRHTMMPEDADEPTMFDEETAPEQEHHHRYQEPEDRDE